MNSPAHALLHHSFQKRMINLQKSFRISANRLIAPQAVSVFFIRRQAFGSFPFGIEYDGDELMAFLNDHPKGVPHLTPVASFGNEKVIPLPIALREERLPQSVDAMLVGKLAIVVGGGMKGDMSVGKVMANLSGKLQDTRYLTSLHGFYEVPEGFFQVPGENAMRIQCVQGVFFYGFLPAAGDRRLVLIQVNIVAGGFPRKRHTPFVGLRSLASKVLNMRPIEGKEGLRQGKDGQAVDAPMRPKAPGVCRRY